MTGRLRPRVYVDATVFIEAFDGTRTKAKHLRELILLFRARPQRAFTSEFTLAEVSGEGSDKGWAVQKRFFFNFMPWGRFIDLAAVSRDILLNTGTWRRAGREGGRKIALPDATPVVTAVTSRCAYPLSSDQRMAVPPSLKLIDPHALKRGALEQLIDA